MKLTGRFWLKTVIIISVSLFLLSWLYYLAGCLNDAKSLPIRNADNNMRPIFVITPTYKRSEQFAELTRLGQTFILDGGIHWIVIEDANVSSTLIDDLLTRFAPRLLGTTHLSVATPSEEKLAAKEARWRKVRGVHQRNTGLAWLRENHRRYPSFNVPVVYFADDDNTYDIRLFDKMRMVKQVGVWPVGLVGKVLYEGPVCDSSRSRILSWRTNYRPDRFCACDMAGFAVSLSLIISHDKVYFSTQPGIGMLEAEFLTRLVFFPNISPPPQPGSLLKLEPIVCDEILVWHTRTMPSDLTAESRVNAIVPATLSV